MIVTPHATFLARSGLLVLPHALLFIPEPMREYLVPPLQRCDRVEVCYTMLTHATRIFCISLKIWVGTTRVGVTGMVPTVSPSAMHFGRVPLHVIVRLQRRWRGVMRLRAEKRREAIAQALHPRLGAASPLASLTLDALRLIAARV